MKSSNWSLAMNRLVIDLMNTAQQPKQTPMTEREREYLQGRGIEVQYWDTPYSDELLVKYFPVQSCQFIDYNLSED